MPSAASASAIARNVPPRMSAIATPRSVKLCGPRKTSARTTPSAWARARYARVTS